MANPEHVAILKQGVDVWNQWRKDNPDIRPDLHEAVLREADLSGARLWETDLRGTDLRQVILRGAILSQANLKRADLRRVELSQAILWRANLREARLSQADLREANLSRTNLNRAILSRVNLSRADLTRANLRGSNLRGSNLSRADLRLADFSRADLTSADLSGADLSGADLSNSNLSKAKLHSINLRHAKLLETNLDGSELIGCQIYGIAAWNLETTDSIQQDLVISKEDEPIITVDSIEVAQFIYLLLNNEKIRSVIDTVTSKTVLILGRFTDERKEVLDAIRDELRSHNYVPILFDFDKPSNRDLTETVMTLAGMSRFVIADLSDPNSIPHEIMSFTEKLLSVPIQAIFTSTPEHQYSYPMYEHLRRYPHVLEIFGYHDKAHLIASLPEHIIKPAEEKAKEMQPPKLW